MLFAERCWPRSRTLLDRGRPGHAAQPGFLLASKRLDLPDGVVEPLPDRDRPDEGQPLVDRGRFGPALEECRPPGRAQAITERRVRGKRGDRLAKAGLVLEQ